MSKHTLEQVLEALINKEDDRASELLHQFFVAKGKQIYEELSSLDEEEQVEEDLEEAIGGSPADDFQEEIIADSDDLDDEKLFSEDEEMDDMAADEPGEEEATAELAMDDEMDAEEPAAEEPVEVRVDDALAELKAAFAELMGEESGEEVADMSMEDEPMEEIEAIGESAALAAVPAPVHGDDGENKKSPVASSKRVDGNGAAAVKVHDGNTAGGKAESAKEDNMGNVNVPGNKKAPALKSVAVPKGSDSASNKTSPVAKA